MRKLLILVIPLVGLVFFLIPRGAVADSAPHSRNYPGAWDNTCWGRKVTIRGTLQDDTINGTSGRDVIFAYGGNDAIFGNGGNDWICGRNGSDYIDGGLGTNAAAGGKDFDTCLFTSRERGCP